MGGGTEGEETEEEVGAEAAPLTLGLGSEGRRIEWPPERTKEGSQEGLLNAGAEG